MITLEVRSRVVGAASNEPSIPTVAIDLTETKITVSKLIQLTVTEQIDRLLNDLGYNAEQTQEMLDRRYLTQDAVDQQAGAGKISVNPSSSYRLPINYESQIRKAREAFKNQAFIIMVDGEQVEHLDEVITLRSDSKVNFIRLTPLRGG